MHRIKFYTLALVAASAIGAVAATSASAAKPEWLQNKAALTGKVKFEASSNTGKLETANGTQLNCSGDSAKGEIEGSKAASNVSVTFTGCEEATGFKAKCQSAGEPAGTIKSELVSGELVYVDAAKTKVGLLLKGTGGSKVFAVFTCAFGVTVTVSGEVIGEVTPLNVEQTTGTLSYKLVASEKGEQEWDEIEGKTEERSLETKIGFGGLEESGIEGSDSVEWKPAGTKVEISA
jgi:hypothetical protein